MSQGHIHLSWNTVLGLCSKTHLLALSSPDWRGLRLWSDVRLGVQCIATLQPRPVLKFPYLFPHATCVLCVLCLPLLASGYSLSPSVALCAPCHLVSLGTSHDIECTLEFPGVPQCTLCYLVSPIVPHDSKCTPWLQMCPCAPCVSTQLIIGFIRSVLLSVDMDHSLGHSSPVMQNFTSLNDTSFGGSVLRWWLEAIINKDHP